MQKLNCWGWGSVDLEKGNRRTGGGAKESSQRINGGGVYRKLRYNTDLCSSIWNFGFPFPEFVSIVRLVHLPFLFYFNL